MTRTFQGIDGEKVSPRNILQKGEVGEEDEEHSGTAKIKSVSFFGTFFFFNSKTRTWSVAL